MNPTSGYKSSEFLTTLLTALALGGNVVPDKYAITIAAVNGVYVAARTVLKAVHEMGYGKNIPDLPDLGEKK